VGSESRSVGCSHPDGLGEGREEQVGFAEGGEVYIDNTISKATHKLGGEFEGKARLTNPWWSEEGDESYFKPREHVTHQHHFALTPDQGIDWAWQCRRCYGLGWGCIEELNPQLTTSNANEEVSRMGGDIEMLGE